jgi:hypothetical protein
VPVSLLQDRLKAVLRSRNERCEARCPGLAVAGPAAVRRGSELGREAAAAVPGLRRPVADGSPDVDGVLLAGVPSPALAHGPAEPGPDRRSEARPAGGVSAVRGRVGGWSGSAAVGGVLFAPVPYEGVAEQVTHTGPLSVIAPWPALRSGGCAVTGALENVIALAAASPAPGQTLA